MTNKNVILITLLSILSTDLIAAGSWKCVARDNNSQEWRGESDYELSAINKAFDACKKESSAPVSCKAAKEECDQFINGQSTRPQWQCVAMDQMGKVWPSNSYNQRDDAALAAKAYCQDKSGFPDTCYINLMTCKNLNSRD